MPIEIVEGEEKMKLTIQVFASGQNYVATCPEFDVYSFAPTKEKAIWRIKKICSFYIDFAREVGITFDELTAILHNKTVTVTEGVYLN